MGAIASQITSLTIVYSIVNSGADQRTHQSSASLAFVWGIYRRPHKWPATWKKFPFDDVIIHRNAICTYRTDKPQCYIFNNNRYDSRLLGYRISHINLAPGHLLPWYWLSLGPRFSLRTRPDNLIIARGRERRRPRPNGRRGLIELANCFVITPHWRQKGDHPISNEFCNILWNNHIYHI